MIDNKRKINDSKLTMQGALNGMDQRLEQMETLTHEMSEYYTKISDLYLEKLSFSEELKKEVIFASRCALEKRTDLFIQDIEKRLAQAKDRFDRDLKAYKMKFKRNPAKHCVDCSCEDDCEDED